MVGPLWRVRLRVHHRASKHTDHTYMLPGGKLRTISGHCGLHVIVMKSDGLPRRRTMAMASW